VVLCRQQQTRQGQSNDLAAVRQLQPAGRLVFDQLSGAHGQLGPHFYVSVNIPPVILGSGEVLTIVEELKLTPYLSRIACEVTERQALTSVGRAALERARQAGMKVAIDDFGTGHSGLMQIVGLSFDILKIDHSLIDTILTDQTAARMLRGIVALAAALRLRTVAEGVETWEEAFFLRAAGVDCGQGWFWSKAVSAPEASRVLNQGYPLSQAKPV
jgi:sensor c-di-GMP phosphodiesterase-like protein